jgi:hypothetical protein
MRLPNRRSLFFALPQVAFTAACAFGVARSSTPTPTEPTSPRATASRPLPTEAPATPTVQEPTAAPRRALPLPTPMESERLWLEEWLDLISLTHRRVTSGC